MLSKMKRRFSVLLVSWKKTQLPRKKQIEDVIKKIKAKKFIVTSLQLLSLRMGDTYSKVNTLGLKDK
jgi:hypothetical protein